MTSNHGLFLPRPADPDTLRPVASTSSLTATSEGPPHPPPPARSYDQQRQQARALRQERRRSPFVPRTSHTATPQTLALLSPAQLADRLDRTTQLLDAALPGTDARLRQQQQVLRDRLTHLHDVATIRDDLAATHLGPNREVGGPEDGDDAMEVVPAELAPDAALPSLSAPVDEQAVSPSAKRRIAAAAFATKSTSPSHSHGGHGGALTAPMSLHDSLALQRRAATLERARAERRAIRAAAVGGRTESAGLAVAQSTARAPAQSKGKGKDVWVKSEQGEHDDNLANVDLGDGGIFGGILFPAGNDTDDSLSETEADDWLKSIVTAGTRAHGGGATGAGYDAGDPSHPTGREGVSAGPKVEPDAFDNAVNVGVEVAGLQARRTGEAGAGTAGGAEESSRHPRPRREQNNSAVDDPVFFDDDDDEDDHYHADQQGLPHPAGADDANGELDEDEDAQLNPLRTAYMRGWNRALKEEEEEEVRGS